MERWTPIVALALALIGCVKDREFPDKVRPPAPVVIAPGVLKVNELLAAGSQNIDEFGVASDWFEIYNPSNAPLLLEAGKWFVTDAGPSNTTKFELPAVTIPGRGFLLIWCNGMNVVGTRINTNFSLSSAGEHLLIFYRSGAQEIIVDDHIFGPQTVDAASEGRYLDGEDNWILFTSPTPGESNQ